MRDFVLDTVTWEKVSSEKSELLTCFNSLGRGKGGWNIKHTSDWCVCERLENKAAGIWPQDGRFKTSHAKIITWRECIGADTTDFRQIQGKISKDNIVERLQVNSKLIKYFNQWM